MTNSGGLNVIVPRRLGAGASLLRLISDPHLGASHINEELLKSELEDALAMDGRILIGGDAMDLILPTDRKRYSPDVVAEKIRGRRDALNAAVEYAVDFLEPYATNIDVIGIGNHETAVEKSHSYDPARDLIARLNERTGSSIAYGGYMAFVRYRLGKDAYTIWYFHGAGSSKDTLTAMRKLNTYTVPFEADLYWMGHHHVRANQTEVKLWTDRRGLHAKDIRLVLTSSYMHTYDSQDQEEIAKKGRRTTYAADMGLKPHGLGGATVTLWVDGSKPHYPNKVEVTQ